MYIKNKKEYRKLDFECSTKRPEIILDSLEQDMRERQSEGNFVSKVFTCYPLIGSKILSQETLDKLNKLTRGYIDQVLSDPLGNKMTLDAEMQITLALVNNAKSWKNEENNNFWNFMSLQFGYRDTNDSVIRLLQTSLENAMKENDSLSLKMPIAVHLSPRLLFMHLVQKNHGWLCSISCLIFIRII